MNKKKPCDCKVCEATEEWFKKRTILEYEAYKKGKEIMSEEKIDIGSEIGQVLADFDQDHDAIKASRNVIQTVYDFRDQSLSDYKSLLRKWVEDDADIYTKEMGENATRTNLIKLDDLLAFIEKGE